MRLQLSGFEDGCNHIQAVLSSSYQSYQVFRNTQREDIVKARQRVRWSSDRAVDMTVLRKAYRNQYLVHSGLKAHDEPRQMRFLDVASRLPP